MIFSGLKEYRKSLASDLKSVTDYLSVELSATIRELRAGLARISFEDNFQSFDVSLEVLPLTEVEVLNELGEIPSAFIVLRKNEGGIYICEGDTEWSIQRLYLKNVSATDTARITVRFFK